MTTAELQALVGEIRCGEWRVLCGRDVARCGIWLRVEWPGRPDADAPERLIREGIKLEEFFSDLTIRVMTEDHVAHKIRAMLRDMVCHEIDEWLTARGHRVTLPRHA